jgi:hypothetical protein
VSVAEKDREYVPVSIRTQVTKGEEETTAEERPKESKPAEDASAEPAKGTVNASSNPTGADVYADGDFVGNSPAVLRLAAGKHTVAVKSSGYADWSKEITVQSGSELQLNANLQKHSP